MMRRKSANMPLSATISSMRTGLVSTNMPTTTMMIFVNEWRHKSRLQDLTRSFGQHPADVSSILTNQSNDTDSYHNENEHSDVNVQRLTSRRKLLSRCRGHQRHLSLVRIPNPEEWAEESRDDMSLPTRMGFSSLSTKISHLRYTCTMAKVHQISTFITSGHKPVTW